MNTQWDRQRRWGPREREEGSPLLWEECIEEFNVAPTRSFTLVSKINHKKWN